MGVLCNYFTFLKEIMLMQLYIFFVHLWISLHILLFYTFHIALHISDISGRQFPHLTEKAFEKGLSYNSLVPQVAPKMCFKEKKCYSHPFPFYNILGKDMTQILWHKTLQPHGKSNSSTHLQENKASMLFCFGRQSSVCKQTCLIWMFS